MKNNISKYRLIRITTLILILLSLTYGLTAKSYKPSFNVQEFINSQSEVTICLDKKIYTVAPVNAEPDTAFIFYPGGKVQYEAYLPLLAEFAKKGVLCVMPKMHHDLAIYNIPSANKFVNNPAYNKITKWYVGGHSLGGAMASVYASKHKDKVDGLILLAAYSTKDFSKSSVQVYSVYGSNDGVLRMNTYEKYKSNLPQQYKELILNGGNHGNFGSYGFQKGDNLATLNSDQQKKITADFCFGKNQQ